jgi:hypothetical protein
MQEENIMTTEIPREKWAPFFDDFSKQHENWIVILEVLGQDIGEQPESTRLPLIGISADLKSAPPTIAIIVGGRLDAHVTHIIHNPKRVFAKPPEEPAHEAIEIEGDDGKITLVHFRHLHPELTEFLLPPRL